MTQRKAAAKTSLLEWISAATGLLLLAFVFAVIIQDALRERSAQPPIIQVEARRITASGQGYLVEFKAINQGGSTAAAVEISGELTAAGRPPETAAATLDYVAAGARASGGLFFAHDPRQGVLALRAEGYQEP